MTQNEIEAFLAISSLGSISKAAEMLCITQPALSRRIKSLENELGFSVFIRGQGSHSIRLTEKGVGFLPIATQWASLYNDCRSISSSPDTVQLKVGSIDSVCTYILYSLFSRIMLEHPEIYLRIIAHSSFEAYRHIETGTADLSFVAYPIYNANISVEPLFEEEFFVIGKNNYFPESDNIDPRYLDPAKEIFCNWNRDFSFWHDNIFGAQSIPRVFVTKMNFLDRAVCDGIGWSIVPASLAKRISERTGIIPRKLSIAPPPRMVYIIRSYNRLQEKHVNWFVDNVKNELDSMNYIRRL